MADLVLSPLITILMRKSADLLAQRIGMMWGIDDQCKKLHNKLLAVQDVLTNAEEQGEAKPAVKSWLANLKSAAYDADDILDEFRYEELRQDAVKRGHKAGKGIVRFPGLFRLKMSRKLKDVVGRIDDLVTEMKTFEFVKGRQERVVNRDPTHSYVIESEVVGRGKDKEELVKLLTEASPTNNLTVIPIIGMGGLGKTTLAQMVYNDPRVKQHFKLLIWVCVSEEFRVPHLIKLIIDTVIKKDSKVPCDNMELLQDRFRQEISGQRYLLVLDDVWNDKQDKWEQLRVLLNCGDLGSTVLVTTRDVRVASIMGAVQSNSLRSLGEEDSWDLFHKRAFGNGIIKERPELVEIGKNLVQNCGGLPLAIKTLGGLMSNKHDVREWSRVLEQSTTWKHKLANNEVLPIVRLSYDHLPSYMKQCFAFCAVFPKDFVMVKEKLVQYWMANGFIPSEMPGNLEMTGSDIFDELAWRSFFQDVEQVLGEHGYQSNETTCKMHDLMHDLAQSVMRDECLSLQESSQIHNTPQCNVRHISLESLRWGYLPMLVDEAIECFPVARSLIFNAGVEIDTKEKIKVPKSNSLRVLDLPVGHEALVMAIPFGKLKHLRYLNLYCTAMKTLPDAITTLYLLQTFRLHDCFRLSELPKGMRYMMSLRHLYIEGCSELQCMPPSLGELKFLQTLSYYIVGTGEGNKIGELNTLNLGGQLEVYNLREISDVRDAKEANMASKQNLDRLTLCWEISNSSVWDIESTSSKTIVVDPFDVLDALKPCSKLKALEINRYIGDKFPIWMTGLENLVELYITESRRCINLPPLHRLPLLELLHIRFMDNLRQLCCGLCMSAEGGEVSAITFPSLKSLNLYEMANLDCWYEGDIGDKSLLIFPVLTDLSIVQCPKLSAIPVTPSLKTMVVQGNNTLPSLTTGITTIQELDLVGSGENLSFKPWVSLQRLEISGFNHIIPPTIGSESEELSVDVNTTALLQLEISECNFWFSPISSSSPLWVWKCFRFVEVLKIENCNGFTSWPEEELSNLIYLREMHVKRCKNFLGSPSEPLSETPTRHALLPKLKDFTIDNCPKMAEIPKLPRSLEKLEISDCPKLECLPEWLGSLVALKQLEIDFLESLNSIPSSIGCLIALETLHIERCPKMAEIPKLPRSLEKLRISDCPKLECLPEWLGSLVALKQLRIYSLESLKSIPSSIGCLIALETLHIVDCINLESLPEGMQGLEALKDLQILGCPKIRILPEGLLQGLRSPRNLWIYGCPLLEKWISERRASTRS